MNSTEIKVGDEIQFSYIVRDGKVRTRKAKAEHVMTDPDYGTLVRVSFPGCSMPVALDSIGLWCSLGLVDRHREAHALRISENK